MDVPASAERVAVNTLPEVNERIERQKEYSLAYYEAHPDEVDARLEELDREWDIERVLETQAASLALGSTVMAMFFGRKWLLVTGAVAGFLLNHGVKGWCPPLPVLRRLGVRTAREIDAERYELMALRGDFDHTSQDENEGDTSQDNGQTRRRRRSRSKSKSSGSNAKG